jgi:hypothetical protein
VPDDPLEDPDVTAALAIVGRRAAGRRLCNRCGHRWLRQGEDLCSGCTAETREIELAGKRDWWERRGARAATKLERAQTWLKSQLRRGPVESRVIRQRAEAAGIQPRTLRRAREELRVDVERRGAGAEHRTYWSI